jgi:hypothetical protein
VKRIWLYPRVVADTGGTGIVSQAAGVALVETIRVAGLGRALSMSLASWRKPLAVHDPAKVITDLAVALGGDCLADVALLRAEPAVFGPVASDQIHPSCGIVAASCDAWLGWSAPGRGMRATSLPPSASRGC